MILRAMIFTSILMCVICSPLAEAQFGSKHFGIGRFGGHFGTGRYSVGLPEGYLTFLGEVITFNDEVLTFNP